MNQRRHERERERERENEGEWGEDMVDRQRWRKMQSRKDKGATYCKWHDKIVLIQSIHSKAFPENCV